MNKRLCDFEKQSGIEVYGLGLDRSKWELHLKEFSRLIITDCINQIEKNYVGSVHSHAGAWNGAVEKCAKEIKNHFNLK